MEYALYVYSKCICGATHLPMSTSSLTGSTEIITANAFKMIGKRLLLVKSLHTHKSAQQAKKIVSDPSHPAPPFRAHTGQCPL